MSEPLHGSKEDRVLQNSQILDNTDIFIKMNSSLIEINKTLST